MYEHKTVYTIYESIGRLNTGSTWSSKLYHKHVSKSDVLDWAVGIQRAISPWTFLIGIKVLRDRTEHYFGLVGNSRTHKSLFFFSCVSFSFKMNKMTSHSNLLSRTHTQKRKATVTCFSSFLFETLRHANHVCWFYFIDKVFSLLWRDTGSDTNAKPWKSIVLHKFVRSFKLLTIPAVGLFLRM